MLRTPQEIIAQLAVVAPSDELAFLASLEIEERTSFTAHLIERYPVDREAAAGATDDDERRHHIAALETNVAIQAAIKELGDADPIPFTAEVVEPVPDPLAVLDAQLAGLSAEDEPNPEAAAEGDTDGDSEGDEGGDEGDGEEDPPATASATGSEDNDGDDGDGGTGDGGGESVTLTQVTEVVGQAMAASFDKLADALAAKQSPAVITRATGMAPDGEGGGSDRRPSLGQVATLAPSPDLGATEPSGHFKSYAGVSGVDGGVEFTDMETFTDIFKTGMEARWDSNSGYTDAEGISGEYTKFMQYELPESEWVVTANMNVDEATDLLHRRFDAWHEEVNGRLDLIDDTDDIPAEIMASGGPCQITERDETIRYLGANKQPFTSGLPEVRMLRAKKEFRPPYWYGDVRAGALPALDFTDGFGVVTEAQDTAGYVSEGGTTPDKACLRIPCPEDFILCDLDELYTCVKIGNWIDAFWPEWVRIWRQMVMDHRSEQIELYNMSRVADIPGTQLMTSSFTGGIGGNSLGALRDTFRDVMSLITHMRSFHRFGATSSSIRMRWSVPDWMPVVLKAAMVTTQGLSPETGFNVTNGQMFNWFRQLGINLQFHCDDTNALTNVDGTPLGLPIVGPQVLPKPAAGPMPALPQKARTFMWIEGTMILGRGPSLNFGQVRDSLLIGTNDWIAFMADFMKPCYMGPLDSTFIYDIDLCPLDKGVNGIDIDCP